MQDSNYKFSCQQRFSHCNCASRIELRDGEQCSLLATQFHLHFVLVLTLNEQHLSMQGILDPDTIKRVDGAGAVSETLERSELWAVQTPQVFRRAALERALRVPAEELARATDDAWLIERAGGRVIVVRASAENLKVTTPFDLRVAELVLAGRAAIAPPRQSS